MFFCCCFSFFACYGFMTDWTSFIDFSFTITHELCRIWFLQPPLKAKLMNDQINTFVFSFLFPNTKKSWDWISQLSSPFQCCCQNCCFIINLVVLIWYDTTAVFYGGLKFNLVINKNWGRKIQTTLWTVMTAGLIWAVVNWCNHRIYFGGRAGIVAHKCNKINTFVLWWVQYLW